MDVANTVAYARIANVAVEGQAASGKRGRPPKNFT